MREFMDYVHSAFYEATGWNRDNSYAALNSTPDGKAFLEMVLLL
jgi:distribution and morphology protein 10